MVDHKAIDIQQIVLHRLVMKLKEPFQTNLGIFQEKDFFIIEAVDRNGVQGFGESVAFPSPWYTPETVETTAHVMRDFLIPLLWQHPIQHPDQLNERFKIIRGNPMAKAAIEGAIWDLYAKQEQLPLAEAVGGTKTAIPVGVSIGIQSSINKLLHVIDGHLEAGYKRIKLKIKPGWDIEVLRQVRAHFPDTELMADANSAYTLKDTALLHKLDQFGLTMIEQPLGQDDFLEHAALQKQMETPICLDENIHSFHDAKMAVDLGSCQVINIKIGRVGGITEAKKIHDYCQEQNIPVWCGGMLEAGVGRAHNIAITTLPQFQFPGDTSASDRYWEQDIIQPAVMMRNGEITVPSQPGIGYAIDWDVLESYRIDKQVFMRS